MKKLYIILTSILISCGLVIASENSNYRDIKNLQLNTITKTQFGVYSTSTQIKINAKLDKTTFQNYTTSAKTQFAPQTRTVNGHALTSNVIVSASDITTGTLPINQLPTLAIYKGSLTTPTFTDNGNGTFTIPTTQVNLYSTDVYVGQPKTYTITGGTFTPVDNATSYLRAYYNGGSPIFQIETDPANVNLGTHASIFTIYRSGNDLHITNWDSLGEALPEKIFVAAARTPLRFSRSFGLSLSEYGTRNVKVTAGLVYQALSIPIDLLEVATAIDNYEFFYHSGGVWTSSTQIQYNNTQYDNGTNLATLTNNRYAVNWVYRGVEDEKHVYIILGSGDYSLQAAQTSSPPTPPPLISSHAILVGRIIVQKNAATATEIDSAFVTSLGTSVTTNHADLSNLDYASAGHTGFAPSTPKYIIQTADASLPNAQATGSLATGILKNTTTTGVLSIAVAGDFPALNQNTTGSAAKLTTPVTINGVSFDGSANIQTATANTSDYTKGATDTAFTVTAHNLTVSGGTGVTYKRNYTQIGDIVSWRLEINPNGGTTASTLVTTYFDLNLPAPGNYVACGVINAGNGDSYGNGMMNGTTLYTPTWAATSGIVVITGTYLVR